MTGTGAPSAPRAFDHRQVFVLAARSAVELLARPEVAARWSAPSVLAHWTVGGLAGHLARGVTTVGQYLDTSAGGGAATPVDPAVDSGEPLDAVGYFLLVMPVEGLDVEGTIARAIRTRGDEMAAAGPAALVRQAADGLEAVLGALEEQPGDRLLQVIGGVTTTLDQYLATRVVELVVHADDLATSVGIDAVLPPEPLALATELLAALARRRRGDLVVLRALARRERSAGDPLAF